VLFQLVREGEEGVVPFFIEDFQESDTAPFFDPCRRGSMVQHVTTLATVHLTGGWREGVNFCPTLLEK